MPTSAARCRCSTLIAVAALIAGCLQMPARADTPTGGIAVAIPTEDVPGRPLLLDAVLWLPQGQPRAAVVFSNGSGGWHDYREGEYGRRLAGAGYAALAIDSFGARGISNTIADQSQLSIVRMLRDSLAGKRFLTARGMAGDRMAIIGWSRGGAVALAAADANFLAQEQDRFRAAIAFYPACNFRPRVPRPRSVVLMALGDRDDYTGVRPCQDIANDYRKAGGKISVKVYPSSTHGFDGKPSLTRADRDFMAETFIDCVAYVEEDGSANLFGKQFDLETGFRDLVVYARHHPCSSKGSTTWTNLEQKAVAARDVMEFLNAAFPD
jgi:dienelactone hydrolase